MLHYKEEDIIEAIKGTGGIISTIAKKLNCSWTAADKYTSNWESTKKCLEDERETVLDLAESAVIREIQNGDIQAAKYMLSTKGKRRGYTEKQEIEMTGSGLPVKIEIIKGE